MANPFRALTPNESAEQSPREQRDDQIAQEVEALLELFDSEESLERRTQLLADIEAAVAAPVSKSEIAKLLGTNFIASPDYAEMLEMSVSPEIPLPANLSVDLLTSPCPFTFGKRIFETHVLAFVPARIGGQPCSLIRYDQAISAVFADHRRNREYRYDRDVQTLDGADSAPDHSSWVLLFKDFVPGSAGQLIADLGKPLERYPDYAPVPIREFTMVAAAYFFKNDSRMFHNAGDVACAECLSEGQRACASSMPEKSLILRAGFGFDGEWCRSFTGLAVKRKL